MARFVMANRRAGKFHEQEKAASRVAMAGVLAGLQSASIIADRSPKDDPLARHVVIFDAQPEEVAAKKSELNPDTIIEPEIFYRTLNTTPIDLAASRLMNAAVARAAGGVFPLAITAAGSPLSNAKVTLFVRGLGGDVQHVSLISDNVGGCMFQTAPGAFIAAVLVEPAGGYWPMVVRGPGAGITIDCPILPSGPTGWWHKVIGINAGDVSRGEGIKVGLIDTGAGPHPDLAHITLVGAFLDDQPMVAGAAQDVAMHGTHTAGIIGARPLAAKGFTGIASGCELSVGRVFRSEDSLANQADIANAIDALSRDRQVDLINMSLGSSTRSDILGDAIQDAFERGTLCVCAAGNDAGVINYPAAYPEAVAVSAVGLAGWGPPGSLAATRLPIDNSRFGKGNLYLANFSCFGSGLGCTAPGVGIISTVPDRFGTIGLYGAMDGTSMACPAVCAALAVMLSGNSAYKILPRDLSRSRAAKAILNANLSDIGLDPVYEGRGMPLV